MVLQKYFGTKKFYKSVLLLLIPIVIQQFISNFVSLLDNIMVGGLGSNSISAVAIVNQVISVYNLAIFGGLSGCSIFGAQFFGKNDMDGMRHTLRFKVYFGFIVTLIGIVLLALFGNTFFSLFLTGEGSDSDPALILKAAGEYTSVMLWGLIPFMVVQVYAGTLREAGNTIVPMVSGIIAIAVNLFGNYLLIEGHLGCPRLEVKGAAIATVVSRYVEMLCVVFYSHLHTRRFPFFKKVYRSGYIPFTLIKRIAVTGTPLLINEILWSLGMTYINQIYSTRSLDAMAALNISGTAWNLFCVIMFGMGTAVSIMIGQLLGAGKLEEARDTNRKLIVLTEIIHIVIAILMILAAPFIPMLYNVSDSIRSLTEKLLVIAGASLPLHSFAHVTYFTIRSGGKTLITFLFDAVYTWCVTVALAYILCHFTDMDLVSIYFCVQFIDIIKLVVGILMLRSDFWAQNIVKEDEK